MGNTLNLCDQPTHQQRRREVISIGNYSFMAGEPLQQSEQIVTNNKNLRLKLEPLLEELKKEKCMFIDPELKTDTIILKSENGMSMVGKWIRANSMFRNRPVVYKTADPQTIVVRDDSMQYFAMFLIFLAKNAHLIDSIVQTRQNSYGFHIMRSIFKQEIIIDDLILANDKMHPLFSQPQDNQIWPLLVEKAWIKANNCNIIQTLNLRPSQVVEYFLQTPSKLYNTLDWQINNHEFIKFSRLLDNRDHCNNFYVLRAKKFNPTKDKLVGIKDKSYLALLTHFKHDGKRFFVLRNPAGNFNFRGEWATLNQPHRQILKNSGMAELKPGNFIIDQQEFTEFIESVYIVYYRPNFEANIYKFLYTPHVETYFKFEIKEGAPYGIRIFQQFELTMSSFMIELVNITKRRLVSIGSRQSFAAARNTQLFDNIIEVLEPGQYILRLKSKGEQLEIEKGASLIIYSHKQNQLVFANGSEQKYKAEFEQFFYSIGEIEIETNNQVVRKLHFSYLIKWFKNQNLIANRVAVYIKKNNKLKKDLDLELYFPQLKNLQCLTHPSLNAKSDAGASIKLKEELVVVMFEKILLDEQTLIGQHSIVAD